jgi:hypothetical protein
MDSRVEEKNMISFRRGTRDPAYRRNAEPLLLASESGTSTIAVAVAVEMVRDPAGPGARRISIKSFVKLGSILFLISDSLTLEPFDLLEIDPASASANCRALTAVRHNHNKSSTYRQVFSNTWAFHSQGWNRRSS